MNNDELMACQSIQAVKARYCRFMDTKQWDAWAELFTDNVAMDVSDDLPQELGDPIIRGRQQVVSQVRSVVDAAKTVHQVHAPEISFISATQANVIWAMSDVVAWLDSTQAPLPGVSQLKGYGHYHERYELVDGQWKIASLKLTRLLVETQ